MKVPAKISLLILALSFAQAAIAQVQKFTVNPDASHIGFGLNGSGHHVEGTFHVQSGAISLGPGAQSIAGLIVVSAGSGNSSDPGRDKKMNSDVLNIDQFPEISFAPKSYQGALAPTGDSTIQVSGSFTLHGTAHDLIVPMQIHIDGSSFTAKGHFVVPYVQWGMKDPSIFVLKVAKVVDIDLNLSGNIASSN